MNVLLASYDRKAAHGFHRCVLCCQPIPQGTVYLDQRWAEDGTVQTFRFHADCVFRHGRAARGLELFDDESLEWGEVLEWEAEQAADVRPTLSVSKEGS